MPSSIMEEAKYKMSPELELVIRCARAKSPENEERIKALFGAGMNWSEILACAIEHKLTRTMCARASALDAGLLTQNQQETLAELARLTGRNNLAFLSEMLRLNGLFEAAGIPAIPYKGPSLGWLAYPNFADRICVDLDFVVPQRFIPEAMSLLQTHGYVPQFSPIEAQAGQHGPAPGEYAFAPKNNFSFVELHTERTLRYFSHPLNLDEMNSRLAPLEIGGQKIRTFSVEDLLVMLSVHGAKHFWERLAWIVDITQLIETREVDWPLLTEIAAKMESTRLLLLGLYLAHEVVGASLPRSVLERARGDAQVQWLAGKVLEQYAKNSIPTPGLWPRAVFRLRSADRYWQGLRRLARLGMSPTERDRETIRLPGFLFPLYTLLRPFRLIREYGWGSNRRGKPDLAIYQPTPPEIVEQILSLADITPEDILYDLGCGDGRIVVAAAEKYGIRAVGIDINPLRISEARANARQRGVENRAQFILGDAKKADFRDASVITMYLGSDANLRLVDRLRAQLRSGARIISRDFPIYGWAPDRIENHVRPNGASTTLYLWIIKNRKQDLSEITEEITGASTEARRGPIGASDK